jgi:hypothetical protein
MLNQNKDEVKELQEFMEQDKIINNYLEVTEDEGKIVNSFIDRYIYSQKSKE